MLPGRPAGFVHEGAQTSEKTKLGTGNRRFYAETRVTAQKNRELWTHLTALAVEKQAEDC
jgi:hypothetical protein